MIALLGRPDSPTDALEDYSRSLGSALADRGHSFSVARVHWAEIGTLRALWQRWRKRAPWARDWLLIQYTALSWSSRGFPIRVLAVIWVLKRRKARVAVVFHDPVAWVGSRLVDRVRSACQRTVM